MEKVKKVVQNEHGDSQELPEWQGNVVFSETIATGYGSCLKLTIAGEDRERNFWWQNQAQIPIALECGDFIRVFYDDSSSAPYIIKAYEKLDGDKVKTRAIAKGYEFHD